MHNESEPLSSELLDAEETLKSALEAACSTHPARADTGELIRIEEMLAIASDAAKRAISIRRRRRHGLSDDETSAVEPSFEGSHSEPRHRVFTDSRGNVWTVWAVHPEERPESKHSRLRGTYTQGWLAFESAVGKRRLSPIPDGWNMEDDAGLESLCHRAEEAVSRVPRQPPNATPPETGV